MDEPSFLHYLPIASTFISAAFFVALLMRASKRNWPAHLNWWAIGVFFYGVGTFFESYITLWGNSPTTNRLWYWAGAVLGAYPLATGSMYLLMRRGRARTVANFLCGLSLGIVIWMSIYVFLTPINAEMIESHRPSGEPLEWQWVRMFSPVVNGLYAVTFLVGGAAWSSVQFMIAGGQGKRAIGTGLIAIGAILPGIGGSLTRSHDLPEALYVGELTGIILIWIGYEFCTRKQKRAVAAEPVPAS
ncbi:MAG: hypothetical protein ACI89L_001830 [Phycisphaerales bacterium]|jgi:hypothetical protein